MIVYNSTKQEFASHVENQTIVDTLYNLIREKHRGVAKAEIRSWKNSLQYMYMVLNDSDIPADAGIAIEYVIPSTPKRVDFLISGYDNEDHSNVIIIELKQWEEAQVVSDKDSIVKTFVGGSIKELAHPSYQAWSYAQLIRDFNASVEKENIDIYPCSYLHNYRPSENDPLIHNFNDLLKDVPLFTSGSTNELRNFIKRYIKKGDEQKLLFEIENGKIRPSKSLQASIKSMLKGNTEFIMVDDQKVAYEQALHLSKQCQKDGQKRVLIIKGGPGTGKSVVAINLLVNILNQELIAHYITKNSAPRQVYSALLKGSFKKNSIDNLFKGSGSYIEAENNELDVAIVDEAHRLQEKSGMFRNKGENQIKEIIKASKLSIFFIDEKQVISTVDIGSIQEIITHANEQGAIICFEELTSQFRCNGSNGYLQWLDSALELSEDRELVYDFDFDFRVYDDPKQLHEDIKAKNSNNKARLLAGYCWEWPKGERHNTAYHDITIMEKNFGISWNLESSTTYAIDKESVNEAGCIHTTQGLEFDYVGVIIGDDLRYQDGGLVTDLFKRAKTDQSLKGLKGLYKKDPEEAKKIADSIIRNTYRTLMTRGQKGCYIYCTDKNLSDYLKSLLGEYQLREEMLLVAEDSSDYN